MKHILFLVTLIAGLSVYGSTNIIATTQYADGSTNLWTQTDLQDALGLMNRKYHRDMEHRAGRIAWHGEVLQQYVMTNLVTKVLYRVDLHSDGYTHHYTPRKVTAADPEAKAKAEAENKARQAAIRAAWEAANLPPELAALRAAQRAAAGTNEVTVIFSR